jgi:hypothetical protein
LAGALFFLNSSSTLFYLRELDSPGYLKTIIYNDAGRLFKENEHYQGSLLFYIENFFIIRYSSWFSFFILGVVLIFLKPEGNKK